MNDWINTAVNLPPEGVLVKARESTGIEFTLKRIGVSWYFPDDLLFVGFKITHWCYLEV